MDQLWDNVRSLAAAYWNAAVSPLHDLTWQTFSLCAAIGILVALIAAIVLRYSWLMSKPAIFGASVRKHAHKHEAHLRISASDYRAYHKLGDGLKLHDGAGAEHLSKNASAYYLVTLVETAKRKAVLYRELRLHVPLMKGRVSPREIQLDASALTNVRLQNGYEDDDDLDSEVAGTYDVYIRRVRFYDIRHWLLHPVREIRTVVWVTIITTGLPTALQVLFG